MKDPRARPVTVGPFFMRSVVREAPLGSRSAEADYARWWRVPRSDRSRRPRQTGLAILPRGESHRLQSAGTVRRPCVRTRRSCAGPSSRLRPPASARACALARSWPTAGPTRTMGSPMARHSAHGASRACEDEVGRRHQGAICSTKPKTCTLVVPNPAARERISSANASSVRTRPRPMVLGQRRERGQRDGERRSLKRA